MKEECSEIHVLLSKAPWPKFVGGLMLGWGFASLFALSAFSVVLSRHLSVLLPLFIVLRAIGIGFSIFGGFVLHQRKHWEKQTQAIRGTMTPLDLAAALELSKNPSVLLGLAIQNWRQESHLGFLQVWLTGQTGIRSYRESLEVFERVDNSERIAELCWQRDNRFFFLMLLNVTLFFTLKQVGDNYSNTYFIGEFWPILVLQFVSILFFASLVVLVFTFGLRFSRSEANEICSILGRLSDRDLRILAGEKALGRVAREVLVARSDSTGDETSPPPTG